MKPQEADGYGEATLPFRAGCDTWLYLQCCDHTGRELARLSLRYAKPEDEAIKVVFTNDGPGRHSLKVDWMPLQMMIPSWAWRWFRIKRQLRKLWRMLKR